MENKISIEGYRILHELGKGGMARVFLAVDEKLDRKVALKILFKQLTIDENFTKRFIKESKIAAGLSHPNIVQIYDVGNTGEDIYFFTMEHFPGNLKNLIEEESIDPEKSVEIIKSISLALDYAHNKGIVHRDLKPDNIMIREDGTPVLVDFGIARAIGSATKLTKTGMSIGTPHYMSPEQARGKKIDGRSDIYSLGVVFYELLTGNTPYNAEDSVAIAIKHIQDPIPILPDNLKKYQNLLDKMMAKDPEDRFQHCEDISFFKINYDKNPDNIHDFTTKTQRITEKIDSNEVENKIEEKTNLKTNKRLIQIKRLLLFLILSILILIFYLLNINDQNSNLIKNKIDTSIVVNKFKKNQTPSKNNQKNKLMKKNISKPIKSEEKREKNSGKISKGIKPVNNKKTFQKSDSKKETDINNRITNSKNENRDSTVNKLNKREVNSIYNQPEKNSIIQNEPSDNTSGLKEKKSEIIDNSHIKPIIIPVESLLSHEISKLSYPIIEMKSVNSLNIAVSGKKIQLIRKHFKKELKVKSKINLPLVKFKNLIFFTTEKGYLHRLDPETLLIQNIYKARWYVLTPPIVLKNSICFVSFDKNIYCVDKDGNLKWKFKSDWEITSNLCKDLSDNIYFFSKGNILYKIDDNGTKVFEKKFRISKPKRIFFFSKLIIENDKMERLFLDENFERSDPDIGIILRKSLKCSDLYFNVFRNRIKVINKNNNIQIIPVKDTIKILNYNDLFYIASSDFIYIYKKNEGKLSLQKKINIDLSGVKLIDSSKNDIYFIKNQSLKTLKII